MEVDIASDNREDLGAMDITPDSLDIEGTLHKAGLFSNDIPISGPPSTVSAASSSVSLFELDVSADFTLLTLIVYALSSIINPTSSGQVFLALGEAPLSQASAPIFGPPTFIGPMPARRFMPVRGVEVMTPMFILRSVPCGLPSLVHPLRRRLDTPMDAHIFGDILERVMPPSLI